MSLKITKNQNVVALKGNLIANTIFQIRRYCKALLEQNSSLHLDLSGLDQLDVSAAIMLRDVQIEAYKLDKSFTVTNGQNEKIVGAFRMLDHQVLQIAA